MSVQRSCILVVRPIITVAGKSVPKVPAAWDVQPEAGPWCTIWPQGRYSAPALYMHARLMVTQGANGAFLLLGPRTWLTQIQALVTYSWGCVADLRADNSTVATTIKSLWVDDRPRDTNGNLVDVNQPIVQLRGCMAGYYADDGESTGP